jgi:hypothetical protein
MLTQLFITIVGGLAVIILGTWFGIGGTTKVVVQGSKVKKTGKWIIIFSILIILGGLTWAGSNSGPNVKIYGLTLAGYGVLFYSVGKIVAWFQRP